MTIPDSLARKGFVLLLLAVPWGGQLQAQFNLLTVREAMSLVDVVPPVIAARKEGRCPAYSVMYWQTDELAIQVRASCGSTAGQQIGYYTVNRRTGEVTRFGDNPESVADTQGQALAAQLVREAQKRILSSQESQCLAHEAAKALPGWNESGGDISVKLFGKVNPLEKTTHFTATRASSISPVEGGRMLTVFLDEARVRDDETGDEVISAGLGDLGAKLQALRSPAWLNDQEAASVALVVPSIARNLRDGCKLYAGGASYSHEALIGVGCNGGAVTKSVVLVDLQTGAVSDPESGKSLESAESRRVTQKLLDQIKARRAGLQKEVDLACTPK